MAFHRRTAVPTPASTRPLVLVAILLTLAGFGCGAGAGGGGSDGGEPPKTAERAGGYSVSHIDALDRLSTASDVNAQGVVVGSGPAERDGGGPTHAFAWLNGTAEDLGLDSAQAVNDAGEISGEDGPVATVWRPDGSKVQLAYGSARALSNTGHVVGEARTAQGHIRAFLWDGHEVTALDTLGGANSGAYAVNDSGQVAGWSENAEGLVRACAWVAGSPTDMGTLGGARSMAYAISAAGVVVGYAATADGVDHAFVAEPDTEMIDLGSLGGYSVAYDVDAAGRVVGESAAADGAPHAFLWENGDMVDLNDLLPPASGWLLIRALAVSDKGHVVGQGLLDGVERAFLLALQGPEPASL
ncbi:MAG: hypothetical protein HZB55_14340 [Deltaproteobacteria bacterium]|nr:hypothetical protein [Deltaproteobacteria bacterium]